MTKPITRVQVDKDSGHAPSYAPSVAWGVAQIDQDKNSTGHSSISPDGPYSGSGNVRVGKEGIGVHRQYDIRGTHIPIPTQKYPNPPPESKIKLKGGNFPWLETASETVFVNTQGCGRAGDLTVCGASVLTGLTDVLVGD